MPRRGRSNIGRRTRHSRQQQAYLQKLSEERREIIRKKSRLRKRVGTRRSLASYNRLAFQNDPTANYRDDDNLDMGLLTTIENEEIGQQNEICENIIIKELQTNSENILNDEDCLQKFLESDITIEDCKKELCGDQIQCLECNESFPDEENLKSHLNTNLKCSRHKCNLCGNLVSKNHLNIHMMQHTDERPFKCGNCGKSYEYLQTLLSHMKTHSDGPNPISPLECSVCKKQFFQKYILRKHLLTHTNKRPYRCKICKKHYKTQATLKVHLKLHAKKTVGEQHL